MRYLQLLLMTMIEIHLQSRQSLSDKALASTSIDSIDAIFAVNIVKYSLQPLVFKIRYRNFTQSIKSTVRKSNEYQQQSYPF